MELIIDNIVVEKNQRKILDTGQINLGPTGMIGLIGPNGAGKSTLLKVLCGIESQNSGELTLNGRSLNRMSSVERAALIGYIPQHFQPCWNQKVAELLELAAEKTNEPGTNFNHAADEFNLRPLLNRFWDSLSGGERGRVTLAMALTGAPPLVLADEPGAALDIGHHLQMLDTFKENSKRCLVVVCMHDLNLGLRYFDIIIFLDLGRVVYLGGPDELVRSNLMDKKFNVDFFKIKTEAGWSLQPRRYIND